MRWFRMYTSLPDSIRVGTLSDAAFRVYVELLCLAGEKSAGGRTGVSQKSINWRLRRDVTHAVTETVNAGLVTLSGDDEYVIGDWDDKQMRSDTSAERTREWRNRKALENKGKNGSDDGVTSQRRRGDGVEKSRTEVNATSSLRSDVGDQPQADVPPPCPIRKIVDLYHEVLPAHPRVLAMSDQRDGHVRARWRQVWLERGRSGKSRAAGDLLAWFRGYFETHVAPSPFLTGRVQGRDGRAPFVADLDWLMRPNNFLKVIEGRYAKDES